MMKIFFVFGALWWSECSALTFAVMGDFGTGGKRNAAIPETRTALMFNEVCERIKCNFSITVGDNIYVNDVNEGFRDSFEDMFDRPMKFFASVGNHDNQGPQIAYTQRSKRWHLPAPWYTVVLPLDNTGYTVQLFAVDSNHGAWQGWLTEELKRSTARWKFIYGHHPMTGSGRHGRMGSVQPLHDLMKQYRAQAYFSGHDHILEYSINQGRANVVTGAMARGGMMQRSRGGAARKWTLTAPSEHNQYSLDWPYHGFMTCDLSPNVMTMTFWGNNGGVQYESVITYDWISIYNQYPKSEYEEPPPDVVRKAFEDEKTLPRGPGGGTAYGPSGVSSTTPKNAPSPPAPTKNGSTPTPLPSSMAPKTYAPTPSTAAPSGITLIPPPTASPARYAVSTECDICAGPTIGHIFTLFLDGAVVDASTRIFLTISSDGCERVGTEAHILDGTKIMPLKGYTVNFNATGPASTPIFVCYSTDTGTTYRRLRRVGSEEKTFVLLSTPIQSGSTNVGAQIPFSRPLGPLATATTVADTDTAMKSTTTQPSDVLPILFLGVGAVGIVVVLLRRRNQS
jgi:hypothetical protein